MMGSVYGVRSATQQIKYDNAGVLAAADDDAFVTALATSASPVTISGAGLNGVVGAGSMTVARPPTLTRSSAPGSYTSGATITWNGIDAAGAARSVEVTLPDADGPDTLEAPGCLLSVTSIEIPAMVDTNGQWKFGFSQKWAPTAPPVLESGGLFPLGFWIDSSPRVITELGTNGNGAYPPWGAFTSTVDAPDDAFSFMVAYVEDLT